MRVYRFDPGVAREISAYGSANLSLVRIAEVRQEAAIHCMYIGPHGLVGYHQAAVSQLFLVVQGEGWVRAEGSDQINIHAGQAAFWESGEWHESGSEDGMTSIVIEGLDLEPGVLLQPISGPDTGE